jgi:toxin ParE1/3/4
MTSEYKIIITRPAQQDLLKIFVYTADIWGKKQLDDYQQKIDKSINIIKQNPSLGRKRLGRLMYSIGKHDLYYRLDGDNIVILRVLHQKMDSPHHL